MSSRFPLAHASHTTSPPYPNPVELCPFVGLDPRPDDKETPQPTRKEIPQDVLALQGWPKTIKTNKKTSLIFFSSNSIYTQRFEGMITIPFKKVVFRIWIIIFILILIKIPFNYFFQYVIYLYTLKYLLHVLYNMYIHILDFFLLKMRMVYSMWNICKNIIIDSKMKWTMYPIDRYMKFKYFS